MFETLADQMKIDEQKETTKRERVILWLVIAATSVILFGALIFGIYLMSGS
jgi:hypothetical protein